MNNPKAFARLELLAMIRGYDIGWSGCHRLSQFGAPRLPLAPIILSHEYDQTHLFVRFPPQVASLHRFLSLDGATLRFCSRIGSTEQDSI